MRLQTTLLSSALLFAIQASAQSQAPNVIWGVNPAHQIWHMNGSQWSQIPGPSGATATQVSAAADGTVWALDQNANIYSYTGSSWQQVSGQLTQVSVGSAINVWGVHSGYIWQWSGTEWNNILGPVGATAAQVSAAADGTVWMLDQNTNIYSYTGSGWQLMPGQLSQVSAGSATNVWGMNVGKMWQWNGSQWSQVAVPSPTVMQVSVGKDGTVYAVDQKSAIYHWVGGAQPWQTLTGGLSQISAGLTGGFFYSYNNPAVTSQPKWSSMTNASAVADGYLQSSNPGDTVTFSFTGDSIALYRLVDVNGGQATVTIDGNAVGYFDFYFQEQRWQIPAVLDHLGAGQHTIVLTVSAQNTQGSTGNYVYIDSFCVPAPFLPTADQQAALTRINFYRNQMGIPSAQLSMSLDLAAQAHANYNAAVAGTVGHVETFVAAGQSPYFTGVNPENRTEYFGYANGEECAAEDGNAGASVDDWMFSVYHRVCIANYSLTDAGFGFSRLNKQTQQVLDVGSNHSTAPAARVIFTYPLNGQTDVPALWNVTESPSNELPSPIAGPPISLYIAQPASTNAPQAATVTGTLTDGSNHPVAITFLTPANDPNQLLGGDTYYIVPQKPLNVSSIYTANISGTDTQGSAFNQTWTFTTGPAADIFGVIPFDITTSNAWVQWNTVGAVTSTQLAYGLSTSYGTTVSGVVSTSQPASNQIDVSLTGLTPGATYHYQITATDAAGNTRTSPDATFVTPGQ